MNAILFRAAVAMCAVMIAFTSAVVIWLSVFDKSWLTYPIMPLPVLMKSVHAGEVIPLSVRRCNSGEATRTYIISHSLVAIDGAQPEVVLPPVPVSAKPGCSTAESRINIIPPGTPPGVYRIDGITEINGWVRNFSLSWASEPFKVVP